MQKYQPDHWQLGSGLPNVRRVIVTWDPCWRQEGFKGEWPLGQRLT